mgnify:CR=1 FL=1
MFPVGDIAEVNWYLNWGNTIIKERQPVKIIRRALPSNKNIVYHISIGQNLPRFVMHAEGSEIIQRLILKALFTDDIEELSIKKSLV